MVDFFGRGGSPRITRDAGSAGAVQNLLAKGSPQYGAILPADLPGIVLFRAGNGLRVPGVVESGSKVWLKVSGDWKQATPWVNVASTWKVAEAKIRVGGTWRPSTLDDAGFSNRGTATTTTGSSPKTVGMPSGIEVNDLLVLVVTSRSAGHVFTTPAGWTLLTTQVLTNSTYVVFYKYAVAGEPSASLAWSGGTTSSLAAQVASFKRAHLSTPIAQVSTPSTNGPSSDIGPITGITIADRSAVVVLGVRETYWTTDIAPLTGDGLSWVEVGQPASVSGSGIGLVWNAASNNTGNTVTVASKSYMPNGASGIGGGLMIEIAGLPDPTVLPFSGTLLAYIDPDDLDNTGTNNASLVDGSSPTIVNKGSVGGTLTAAGTILPTFTRLGGPSGKGGINYTNGRYVSSLPSSSWNFLHDGTPYTLYYVHRSLVTNPNNLYALVMSASVAGSSGSRGMSLLYDDRVGSSREDRPLYFVSNGTILNGAVQGTDEALSPPFWHLHVAKRSVSGFFQYVDRKVQGSDPVSGAPSATDATSTLTLGSTSAGLFPHVGVGGILLIYSGEHTDAERGQVENYLDKRFPGTFAQVSRGLSYVGTGAANMQLGTATPQNIALPPNTSAGDLMVLTMSARSSAAVLDTPPGWTLFNTAANGFGTMSVFWKLAGIAEPAATVTFTATSTATFIGQIAVWRGADLFNPIAQVGVSASNGSSANIGPIPGIDIKKNNAVAVIGWQANDWTAGDLLTGDGLSWVELSEASTVTGGDAGIMWDMAINSTGADVTVTPKTFITDGAGNVGFGFMFEIQSG